MSECPRCDGTGEYQRLPWDPRVRCAVCNGSGKLGEPKLSKRQKAMIRKILRTSPALDTFWVR